MPAYAGLQLAEAILRVVIAHALDEDRQLFRVRRHVSHFMRLQIRQRSE